MASTRAFRARPVDISRPLPIVRDLSLLDSTEGLPARDVVHNHAALDAENEKPKMIQADGNGAKEIPIPGVQKVPTYQRDYLPAWQPQNTYIKFQEMGEEKEVEMVEYDLDTEDEEWLARLNDGQERLSKSQMEAMLWRLEIHNAAATERALSFAGATPAERMSAAACSTTDHMPREDALQMLEESCPGRDVLRIAVYEYWLEKRKRLDKPLLRRLQAQTPANDNNPFNVFRPREKVHRPQTRRRRENTEDSLEKLRMIRENVLKALEIFEMLVRRERKKRDLLFVATDLQQLQLKLRFEPRSRHDQIEEKYWSACRNKVVQHPIGLDLPDAVPSTNNRLLEKVVKEKKRRKLGQDAQLNAVAHLASPPRSPPASPLFLERIDIDRLPASAAPSGWVHPSPAVYGRVWQTRFGRGGRLVLDRCNVFELGHPDASDDDERHKPVYEQANPYSEWLNKDELARNVLEKLSLGVGISDMLMAHEEAAPEHPSQLEEAAIKANGVTASSKENGRRGGARLSRTMTKT